MHDQPRQRLSKLQSDYEQLLNQHVKVQAKLLNLQQEYTQSLSALGAASEQAASSRQEAERARLENLESRMILTEILNSKIWKITKYARKIKDGISQRFKVRLRERVQQSHKPNFEEGWKCNRDLIRQSKESGHCVAKGGTKIIIIDWKCPEADKDSGSHRMDSIIQIMLELGITITFCSEAINQEESYINRLRNLGIPTFIGIELAMMHLALAGQSYEYIILARPDTAEVFLPFIQLYCPKAKIIYDTVDLHYLRMRRALRIPSGNSEAEKVSLKVASEKYYAKEMIISRSSDRVIVVSDEEKKILSNEDKTLDIVTIPNIHTIVENTPGFEKRNGLLFIGGFDHQPNNDAMIYFCNEILPKIAEHLDGIKLTIVGSNMPKEIFALGSKYVKALGYVEDLDPILSRSRVFVAPLRYGAGIKGKVGLSMAHGLPVVGTSTAAEGFGLNNGEEMLIADDPSLLARDTIRLYQNKDLWTKLSIQGKIFIRDNYSPLAIKDRIADLLNPTSYAEK